MWMKGDLQDVWFLNPQSMVDNLSPIYEIHVDPWIDPCLSSLQMIRCSPIRSTRWWILCFVNLLIWVFNSYNPADAHEERATISNVLATRSIRNSSHEYTTYKADLSEIYPNTYKNSEGTLHELPRSQQSTSQPNNDYDSSCTCYVKTKSKDLGDLP